LIKNESIEKKVGEAPIIEKIVKSPLKRLDIFVCVEESLRSTERDAKIKCRTVQKLETEKPKRTIVKNIYKNLVIYHQT
jgi:hypothetical protein